LAISYRVAGSIPFKATVRYKFHHCAYEEPSVGEAFAVQAFYCRDRLRIDPERLNVNGGGIAAIKARVTKRQLGCGWQTGTAAPQGLRAVPQPSVEEGLLE
jgi:hypothetical protein